MKTPVQFLTNAKAEPTKSKLKKIVWDNPNQMEFQFVIEDPMAQSRGDVTWKNKAGEVFPFTTEPAYRFACNSKKPYLDFVEVSVMEFENGMWTQSVRIQMPRGGTSSGLSATWVYKSRSAAIRAAFQSAQVYLSRSTVTKSDERVRVRLLKEVSKWMEIEGVILQSKAA